MFTRILVGIDEETSGRDAIALARKLADGRSTFTFAHVFPAAPAATPPLDDDHAGNAYRLLTSVAHESGLEADRQWTGAATVGAGLRTLEDRVGPDLLVVGTTSRSRLVRALLGNPTTGTLTRARCVVAVAPEGYAENDGAISTIAVAYDGTTASEAALDFARELASARDATLSTFEVVAHHTSNGFASPRRPHKRSAQTALATKTGSDDRDERFMHHLTFGDPVEELASYSGTVDVVVAGARGIGRLARLLHPSTTLALTDVIQCPLLVLPNAGEKLAATDSSGSQGSAI